MKIAVIGGGISGMMSLYLLQRQHEVTLFEANDYLGGHTATVDVEVSGQHYAIDTGFIVFNNWTYPLFNRFLAELAVPFQPTEMSFSVKNEQTGLEYNGNSLRTLFAQKRNLFKPSFWKMLLDIVRFNKVAKQLLAQDHADLDLTVGDFLNQYRFGDAIREQYLLPMGAAIWSAGLSDMPSFPLRFFLRFFDNHGLLSVNHRPQWSVICGGSREYVRRLQQRIPEDSVQLSRAVSSVTRHDDHVIVTLSDGQKQQFDRVVFACHSDQALAMLADPTAAEQAVLGGIAYQNNEVVLHTDSRLLPVRPIAWAAWNYNLTSSTAEKATLTYNMNILQQLTSDTTFCVTLNNTSAISKDKILRKFQYAHPVFNRYTMQAQQRRAEINGQSNSYFCGAYWYNGFHEDGVRSAVDVAAMLGVDFADA
ncbi:FAD-dependent oxidoreductase [Alkalimonas collagenimarina]|uniref:FAD-dependent oxidoreductase n=1 Tax=Alkalimonas collagenimarina TaxID=400390 RepID=A0ABT9H0W5_9GAMM|nr:FAD-dependent oxidoreductase [Alkalimonas collagenimarina]MDP4536724.1 FAD-dependent oxidoreductase [Alkalimonas collagenimarina]